jgi:propionate CoA-transferase
LKVAVDQGRLKIVREGKSRKFVESVEQVSFSAARSRQVGQEVLYVTERAIFQLNDAGLELIEIAPGIDLESQVLDQMAYRPTIRVMRPMSTHIFL